MIILTPCKLKIIFHADSVVMTWLKPGHWLSYPLHMVEVNEAHEINQVLS
jgi:hypothetical protein